MLFLDLIVESWERSIDMQYFKLKLYGEARL